MAILVSGEGAARGLAFVYMLLAARVLEPAGFGVVRYTLAVAMIALGPIMVVATALGRELGHDRGTGTDARDVMNVGMAIGSLGIVVMGIALVAASQAGVVAGTHPVGLSAAFVGLGALQLYYAATKGLGETSRAARVYVAGAALQLLVLALLLLTGIEIDAGLILVTFGLSSLAPVLFSESRSKLVGLPSAARWRVALQRLTRIGVPFAIAPVAFLVWMWMDQVWVENTMGTTDAGLYGAAKQITQVFVAIAAGVNGALMPRVAQLHGEGKESEAKALILRVTRVLAGIGLVLAAILIVGATPILSVLFGEDYEAAAPAMAVIAAGMVCFLLLAGLCEAAVGWGRPAVYSGSIATAALIQGAALAVVDPDQIEGVAWVNAASVTVALVVVVGVLRVRPLRLAKSAPGTHRH